MRSHNWKIAIGFLYFLKEFLKASAKFGTLRQPQRKSHSHLGRECEELHFLSYFPVVPLLGLLHKDEVLIQQGFLRERYSVDTGELLTFLVSSPVGTCYCGEFHCLDDRSVTKVRSPAEVCEIAAAVETYGTVFQVVDELDLVFVTFFSEGLEGVCLGHVFAYKCFLCPCKLHHLVFYGLEVSLGNLASLKINIVVESVFKSRSNSEFHTRIEVLKGLGHKVCRRMPENSLRLLGIPFMECDGAIFVKRPVQIVGCLPCAAGSLDGHSQNVSRKPRADSFCNLITGYAVFERPDAAVWKCNVNHNLFCF